MITDLEIQAAEQNIARQIADQCLHGAQSANLGAEAAACGQFFSARDRRQRGLHGTAAALRLVAEAQPPGADQLVARLVKYLSERQRFDTATGEALRTADRSFEDDESNVIKLSEVLHALLSVTPAQCQKDTLVATLVERLLGGYKENKGWSHFLGGDGGIDPLPTAFAMLALCRNGYENRIVGAVDFVKRTALEEGRPQNAESFTEVSVRIFCLYALVFRKDGVHEPDADEIKKLKAAFTRHWRDHERLLGQDLEQNIEYWKGATNFYVRIPWQLYLLALAAQLSPWRIYSSVVQRKLTRILHAARSKGFCYPYSGNALSTRSNAILYDTLKTIRQRRKYFGLAWLILGWDRLRTFLGHPAFRWIALGLFVLASAAAIYAWAKKGELKDVGPDLTGALIGFFVASLIQSLRKDR